MNIWSDCKRLPITELLDFVVDNRGKTVPLSDNGYKLIATNCVKNDSLYPKYEKIRFLSQETYDTFFRAHPLPGDILFVNKGTPGRVCLVPDPVDFCIAQDMIALRVNPQQADNHYLLAVLRSDAIQRHIYNLSVGDVIPHFKKQFLDTIEIPIPPMPIQKRIGSYYYNLSSKIELNNKINAQLEEMAQALFKEWFVDFGPFKDGKFVESELGLIPEGWRVGTLSEYCKVKSGFAFKSSWWTDFGCPVIKIKNITDSGNLDMTDCSFVSEENTIKACDFKAQRGDLIIAMTGATIGKFNIVPQLDHVSFINQRVGKFFLGSNPLDRLPFVYCLLRHGNNREQIIGKGQGSAQPNISGTDIESLSVLLPPEKTICLFNEKHKPLFDNILTNQEENRNLSQLRDTLLPKLMNGEIDLDKYND